MARSTTVEISKTIDGKTVRGRVLPSSLKAWESCGWTAVEDESSEPTPDRQDETQAGDAVIEEE